MAEIPSPFERRADMPLTEGLRLIRLEKVIERLMERLDTSDENVKILSGSLSQERSSVAGLQKVVEDEVEPYARETRTRLARLRNWVFYIISFLAAAFVGLSGIARTR